MGTQLKYDTYVNGNGRLVSGANQRSHLNRQSITEVRWRKAQNQKLKTVLWFPNEGKVGDSNPTLTQSVVRVHPQDSEGLSAP